MFRFFATIWNHHDPDASAHAALLSARILASYGAGGTTLRRNGLTVHWTDTRPRSCEPYLLADEQGVILGKVFSSSRNSTGNYEPAQFGSAATAEVLKTNGRALVERFWGRYVAFLHDNTARVTRVVRDPIGKLPCFMTSSGGVDIVFCAIEDCITAGLRFSINWDYVAMHLASGENERLNGTGLANVSPILAGECVEWREEGTSRQFYWHPESIANSNIIHDPHTATDELRRCVVGSVQAWASCYGHVLLRLSGGFDSSVVATCLHRAPSRPEVTCLNHYSAGGGSDERRHARSVAQYTGFDLIERQRTATSFSQLSDISLYPYARYARYAIENSRVESSLARKHGASAIFSGELGDALFYFPVDGQPAIDYVWQNGLRPALFSVALDVARREGLLVWSVIREAIVSGLFTKPRWDPHKTALSRYRSLLSKDIIERARAGNPFTHPWAHLTRETPTGKGMHIFQSTLIDVHPFYDPLAQDGDPDHIAPLISQPVVEACLRIPTYLHTMGGWDRSIARRAFADALPRSIVARRTKGEIEAYQKMMFAQNIDYARSTLLNGALVRFGILDRTKLEAALSADPTQISTTLPELYWYLCMESWIATWQREPQRRAA